MMTHDDLEFSISQYLDGTLPPADGDALETRLGSDAAARALYAEYEALQGALASAPLPAVRWDRFAEQISAAVAREPEPAQSYKLGAWLRPARLALAASVLLAGTIALGIWRSGAPDSTTGLDPAPPQLTRIVLKPDPATAAAVASVKVSDEPIQIVIGPSATEDDAGIVRVYASDSIVRRPSKAVIVSAAPLGQDGPQTPFQ